MAATMLLAGCATLHDPGWEGADAQPFDQARAQCEAEAAAVAAGDARDAAFAACMAAKGWTRPAAQR
jgi:hypothetical protein